MSSYLSLRSDLIKRTKDRQSYRFYDEEKFSEEDEKKVISTLEQIDNLHNGASSCTNIARTSDGHVDIIKVYGKKAIIADGTLSITNEASVDPQRSAQLFRQLYKIVRKYEIAPEILGLIGKCFEELHLEIPKEIEKAAKFGRVLQKINFSKSCGSNPWSMRWKDLEEIVGDSEITTNFLYELGYKPFVFSWQDKGR